MENAVAILPTTRVDLQREYIWKRGGFRGLLLLAQFLRRNSRTQCRLPLSHARLLGVVLMDHRSGTTNSAATFDSKPEPGKTYLQEESLDEASKRHQLCHWLVKSFRSQAGTHGFQFSILKLNFVRKFPEQSMQGIRTGQKLSTRHPVGHCFHPFDEKDL
jgi:hypothetical protein